MASESDVSIDVSSVVTAAKKLIHVLDAYRSPAFGPHARWLMVMLGRLAEVQREFLKMRAVLDSITKGNSGSAPGDAAVRLELEMSSALDRIGKNVEWLFLFLEVQVTDVNPDDEALLRQARENWSDKWEEGHKLPTVSDEHLRELADATRTLENLCAPGGKPALHEIELDSNWWSEDEGLRPPEYKHGPLTDNLQTLSQWMGAKDKRGRRVQQMAEKGQVWVWKHDRRSYSVWFREAKIYAAANQSKIAEEKKPTINVPKF